MIALATHAMGTRFELLLYGSEEARLRAAGEEALSEIERLDAQLSDYRADSEISWINAKAAHQAVRVEPRLFRLLQNCATATRDSDGAFDITIGPLIDAWRSGAETATVPTRAQIEMARQCTGMEGVELDESGQTVRFIRQAMRLDLGAYGKGYAIEQALRLLREQGLDCALLQCGTSSVGVIGRPAERPFWRIRLSDPFDREDARALADLRAGEGLSVSALHGRTFQIDRRDYGHVIDPRTGSPCERAIAAAVVGPSPATCEVLSTALMVNGPEWLERIRTDFAGYRATVAYATAPAQIGLARLGM